MENETAVATTHLVSWEMENADHIAQRAFDLDARLQASLRRISSSRLSLDTWKQERANALLEDAKRRPVTGS